MGSQENHLLEPFKSWFLGKTVKEGLLIVAFVSHVHLSDGRALLHCVHEPETDIN